MDLPIQTNTILANTHGQSLSQHLFAVGYLAYQIMNSLKIGDKNLAQAAFTAGILHDIGKLDPQFQQWLSKKVNQSEEDIILPEDGVHIDTSIRGFKDFSFEDHPRHNEISWLLAESLLTNTTQLNPSQIEQVLHSIYWHHTRPYRKDDKFFNSAEGIDKKFKNALIETSLEKFTDQVIAILKDIQLIADNFNNADFSFENLAPKWSYAYQLTKNDLPAYKKYSVLSEKIDEFIADVKPNALNNLVRMAVINADRIVSSMSAEDLTEYLVEGTLIHALDTILLEDSQLAQSIHHYIASFNEKYPNSERNILQDKASTELAQLQENAEFDDSSNVAVLQGPAGCGKTKIALEWALKTNVQKIIWVCPRVQVCLGLLNDLTETEYLPNSRIEIFTGEYKKILHSGIIFDNAPETESHDYFTGDIVITTIDQVINNIISHQKITGMVDFMQAHVVFDEFHELIPMPAFNLFFAELIEAKKMKKHCANTLLVSATPHDYFVEHILQIDTNYIVRIPSFNQADYKLEFLNYDETAQASPLIIDAAPNDKTTFIITNTAQDAQLGFLLHQNAEESILLHSKYTKIDKSKWFNQVFNSFKRYGNNQYKILRSGPIVQASLNISCEQMYTDLTSAENWLQRLGRLDRFDTNKIVNIYTTVVPQKSAENGKQISSKAKFLANMHVWQSTLAWLGFLQNHLHEKEIETLKINDLYQIYQDFYLDATCQRKISEDLQNALRDSVELINRKVLDPISLPTRSKKNKDSIAKIASVSLRGDNRFVQMAVCEVDDNLTPNFVNEYAYPENTDHSKITIGLTESSDRIQGGRFEMRDSNKNLLAFMHNKHHNVMKNKNLDIDYKKSKYDWELLKLARSPEYPIYLSYIPSDLDPLGGETVRHSHAIYYVKTAKQPVGIMSIDKLFNPKIIEN